MNRQKHKLPRRILAILLAVAMFVTMFPAAMFAEPNDGDGQGKTSVTGTDNGVTVNKYVTGNEESGYNLTLEAYASDQLTTGTTTTPLDITLVLDVSGSMEDPFIGPSTEFTPVYNLDRSQRYYVKVGDSYRSVSYIDPLIGIFFDEGWSYWNGLDQIVVDPMISESDSDPDHKQFYTAHVTGGMNKMEGLQTAANNFIEEVAAKNLLISDVNSKHHISIVKFADNDYADKIGNDKAGFTGYNYTQVVSDFTDDSEALKDNINALEFGGATAADYGLSLASDVMTGNSSIVQDELKGARQNSKKVVIFFTDGSPTYNNGFEQDVANAAIREASELKNNNVDVYSVGVFEDETDLINTYMQGISSNYPSASSLSNLGERKSDKYYFTATDPDGLTKVFENIADSVTTGNLTANPNTDAVLSDTLSEYFRFPEGVGSSSNEIQVRFATAKSYDPASKTFDFNEPGNLPEGSPDPMVTVEDGTITVSNFDYKTNAASYNTTTEDVSGGKLVVTFPIELDENACLNKLIEGNLYPTNDTGENKAKLSYKSNDNASTNDAETVLDESPTVYKDFSAVNANGSDVTVQVYLDGVKQSEPLNFVNISRDFGDTPYKYFELVDTKTDGTLVYDFNYFEGEGGYDCVDLKVGLDNDQYILQGVTSYQAHGENGTKNVTPHNDGTYTVDNVTASDEAEAIDCIIYLSNKYSVEYTVNGEDAGADYEDTNTYVVGSVAASTDEKDYPQGQTPTLVNWKNDGYRTSIMLEALPTEEGYDVDGWFVGEDTKYDPASSSLVNVVDVAENANEKHVIIFNATKQKSGPDKPDEETLVKDLGAIVTLDCVNETINSGNGHGESLQSLIKDSIFEISEVTPNDEGVPTITFKVTPADEYLTAYNSNENAEINGNKNHTMESTDSEMVTATYVDGKWTASPVKFNVICENPLGVDTVEKTVVTSENDVPEGISQEDLSDVVYPAAAEDEGNPTYSAEQGDTVKFLYKITMSGDSGAHFSVTETDPEATLVKVEGATPDKEQQEGTLFSGTMSADEAVLYVTVEYTFDEMEIGKNVKNIVTVDNTDPDATDPDDGEETVDVDVTPKAPEIIAITDAVKVACNNTNPGHGENQSITYDLTEVQNGYSRPEAGVVVDGDKYTYTITINKHAFVNAYKTTVTSPDHNMVNPDDNLTITLEYNADNKNWVPQEQVPVTILVNCVTPVSLSSVEKVVMTADQAVKANISGDYDYPEDGTVDINAGDSVTLLYKITVNGQNVNFAVEDNGAKLVTPQGETAPVTEENGKFVGSITGNTPVSFYVAKEFTYEEIVAAGNKAVNSVKVETEDLEDYIPQEDEVTTEIDVSYKLNYDANGGKFSTNQEIASVTGLAASETSYSLWSEGTTPVDDSGQPLDEPEHDPAEDNTKVLFAGWSEFDSNGTIYSKGDANVPDKVTSVIISTDNKTVYAIWSYDKNNNDVPDIDEDFTLTYDANGGSFAEGATSVSVEGLMAGTYDLWSESDKTVPEGSELPERGPVEGKEVAFLGWTDNQSAAQTIYSAGEEYPSQDTVTIPQDAENNTSVVYAVWGYDTNGDGIADAEQIVVMPADIIIYTGGQEGQNGYEGVVNDQNQIEGSRSLPEPGFIVTLPYEIKDTQIIDLKFTETTETNREWQFQPYDGEHTTVYKLVPTGTNPNGGAQDPVRVEFTTADGTKIVSSEFTVGLEVNTTFGMGIYKGAAGAIQAKVEDKVYTVNSDPTATLTVRGTTDQAQYAGVNAESSDTSAPKLEANEETTFTINNSDVEVVPENVALLFDEIIDSDATTENNDRVEKLEDKANTVLEASEGDMNYDFKYLDLVDTQNGNAWVKASDNVTIYWPLPEGATENTEFTLLHFEGLHRDMAPEEIDGKISSCTVDTATSETAGNHMSIVDVTNDYVIIQTGANGFSPFALAWDAGNNEPDWPPYYPWHPDGDDDGPSGLNTEDHFSYVVGYAEDYRTGEATDNEDLWPVKPNNQITRAEVATIFYRLLEDEVRDEYDTTTNDFSDVTADSWYNQTVSTLARMGIVKGYEDGSFRPNAPITRAEFGAIATRFFAETGATYEPGTFTDVTGDEWYANAIQDAVNLGLIGGYPDGTVRPNNNITRAEACAIVNRTLGRVPDADHLLPEDVMKVWPDNNPTDWFYADMQEATNGHEYAWIEEDGHEIEEWTNLLDKDWTDR